MDRAHLTEQGIEQHGECSCHDQVRKIDNGLEKSLALQSECRICKPCSQKQGYQDLRYETDDPHNYSVTCILEESGIFQKLCIVLQSYIVRSNNLQTRHEVLKETVVDCAEQRDQRKDCVDNEERNEEVVSPFVVFHNILVWFIVHNLPLLFLDVAEPVNKLLL